MGSKAGSLLQWVLFIVIVFSPIYGLRGSASQLLTVPPPNFEASPSSTQAEVPSVPPICIPGARKEHKCSIIRRGEPIGGLQQEAQASNAPFTLLPAPASITSPVNREQNGIPVAAPPKELSDHLYPVNHSKGFSPAMIPMPPEVKNESNTTEGSPVSPSHQLVSSPMMSPVPHEGKQPLNITGAPLPSNSGFSGSSSATSPVPHDKQPPSSAHAPQASHLQPLGSPTVIDPMPLDGKMTSNITHSPTPSSLHPSESPPGISPTPREVKEPSNITHSPPPSRPIPSGPSPVISPTQPLVKEPSNITDSPLPSESSPVTSPAPPQVKEPSNATHSPLPSESSPVTSPTPPQVKEPPNVTHSPLPSHPLSSDSSPVMSPMPPEVKEPSNATHSLVPSHPIPSESAPVTSPTPPEVKQPPNTMRSPLPSHLLPSESSPAISPALHEVIDPSNNTHAPFASHLKPVGSSPVISPAPHGVEEPSNITHSPLPSHPLPSVSSPVISPTPPEVMDPTNITYPPLVSDPKHSTMPPMISPTPHEVKDRSNTTHSPLPSHPPLSELSPAPAPPNQGKNITHAPSASHSSPLGSSPVLSPTPHEVKEPPNATLSPLPSPRTSPPPHELKDPSNITHSPFPSPPHQSELSPAVSPVPHRVKHQSNATHAPMASPPHSSLSSPLLSPMPHEAKNTSTITHAPLPSPPNSSKGIQTPAFAPLALPPASSSRAGPEVKEPPNAAVSPLPSPRTSPPPHEVKDPSNITHSPFPSPPHQSELSPAPSPVPQGVKHQSNATHAPVASPPHPSLLSPLLSPMPHEAKNTSSITLAPLPSPPNSSKGIQTPAFAPVVPPPSSRRAGPMISPVSSHIPAVSPSNEGSKHAPSPHIRGLSISPVQAPSHPPVVVPKNDRRNHAPSLSPIQAPYPSANIEVAHSPSPSSVIPSQHRKWPIHPPVLSPGFSRKPRALPPKSVWAFPPPPPNLDCKSLSCQEPSAYPPPGSVCKCVLPINVGLRLNVSLYTFFPLISELAQEIASGIFVKQSQVRIMGANSTTEDVEKTSVFIDLVPFGLSFDMNMALLIFERFWHKQVLIKASYFGDYDVLYVRYPGLPPSPPMALGDVNVDGGIGNSENARTRKPLGVDVGKRKEKLSSGLIAIVVLASVIALVISIGAAWFLLLKCRDRSSQPPPTQHAPPPSGKPSGTGPSNLGSGPSSTSASFTSSIAAGSAKTFNLAEMERATDRFHESKVIGEGGFGCVYQGTLEDGTMVAVKVLKRHDHQGGREFLAEVEMLSRLHHRNLVKLIGICAEEKVRCLVYELIPNGSVESHLHGLDKETSPLDWDARMKIALGAARGLAYLHEDSSPRVIHRDFKSSNILLEHDFTPKVSDFGLARTALDEGNEHISTCIVGTFGYVAPEYAMTGHLLVKSDVYSYGVVLLELLTGRKPVDMSQPPVQENLVSWARPLLTSMDGLEKMVDPALGASISLDNVAMVAAIASMCVEPEVSHRPYMGEVLQALKLVCNESEEHRRSCNQDELSTKDSDIRISTGIVDEKVLLESDIFCTSAAFDKDASGSFRRYSSSGPLTTDRRQKFWEKVRGFSSGRTVEHGIARRPGSGLHGGEHWP